MTQDLRIKNFLHYLAVTCGVTTAAVSVLAILGWLSNWLFIARIHPRYVPMAPSTALSLFILGVALLVVTLIPAYRIGRLFAQVAVFSVLLLGFLVLLQFFGILGLDPEPLHFRTAESMGGIPIGHMSPITATALVLSCLTLISIIFSPPKFLTKKITSLLTTLVIITGLIMILGYLYGTPLLYGGTTVPVALTTAIVLVFLGMGLLAILGPQFWPLKSFLGPSVQARLLRTFLPVVIVIVLIEDWFIAVFAPRLQTNPALVTAWTAILLAVVLAIIISKLSQLLSSQIDQAEKERQQAEMALRESEEHYRSFFENSIDAVLLTAPDGRIFAANPAACHLFGYTEDEICRRGREGLVDPGDPRLATALGERTRTGKFRGELTFIRQGGAKFLAEISSVIFRDREGRERTSMIIRDVTERKRAEEALRESEHFAKTILASVGEGVIVYDREFRYRHWNRFMEKLTGLSAPEVIGKVAFDVFPHLKQEGIDKLLSRALAGEIVYSADTPYLVPLTGEKGWVTGTYSPHVSADGEIIGVVANVRDITERKQAEEELRESAEQFSKIFRANPAAISIATYDEGRFLDMNDSFLRMLGFTREEVVGRTAVGIGIWPKPEDRQKMINLLQQQPSIHELEVTYGTKSGGLREGLASFELIELAGEKCIIAMFHDLTERKHLEAQLLQAQKMEAVGTLAGGVAHDFNNLLTTIIVNLELAKDKMSKKQPLEPHLEEIETVAQRAAQLIKQLLAFSRRQILQPVPLNLNSTVSDLSKMFSRLLGEHIELELHLPGGLWMVKADPGQLEQVIMNLVVNARDAMPRGGKLTLKTQNASLDEVYVKDYPWVKKGDYVLLEVTDTGAGMDTATKGRIFEPFFTTKEVGKGTGLGLSMVFGIVKQHEGYINVYSEAGQGTTFKIYLPRLKEEVVTDKVRETPQKVKGGQETILLAEDEEQLREAIKNVLEMYGYNVLTAGDGQEAVEIYEQERKKVELVILDAVMPRMGGIEAADYIYKLKPSQKILFSSGYSAEGFPKNFVIPPDMHFIQKPYTAKALAQKVREVLEG